MGWPRGHRQRHQVERRRIRPLPAGTDGSKRSGRRRSPGPRPRLLVLALEHAAAYMLAGDGMPLAEYRRIWKERLKWTAKGHAYPNSVAAALGLSIDAVAKESGTAYDLLCLFAW